MTYEEQFLSHVRFSSSYRCDSLLCAARWYETLLERCRPRRACRIWFKDGFLHVSSNKSPQHLFPRFFVHSVRNWTTSLAEHPKKVVVFASIDKITRNKSLLTISCNFTSRKDAIEWHRVLQILIMEFESENKRLEIIQLYLHD